jgi:hypothetical protein
VGEGGEMTQALYAHMNNKKKIGFSFTVEFPKLYLMVHVKNYMCDIDLKVCR